MKPQWPVLDVFIGKDHDAWRLYVAGSSWCPPMLRDRLDANREAFPVAQPDLDDLDRHMWATDSPYEKTVTTNGGAELLAKGRSAVTMLVWLEGLFDGG